MKLLNRLSNLFFCLFLFCLPISTIFIIQESFIGGFKFQYGSFGIYGSEVLFWIAAVLFVIANYRSIFLKFKDFKSAKLSRPYFSIPLLLFILFCGVSILSATDKQMAFFAFFRILEAIAVFSYALINFKKSYLWILFVSGVVQAVFAIAQFLSQAVYANKFLGIAGHLPSEAGALVLESSGRWLRAYGLVNDPNLLGVSMVFAILIGIYLYFKSENKLSKIFLLAGSVFLGSALFFSFSRSAWIAFVVAVVISGMGIIRRRDDLRKFFPPVIAVLGTLVVFTIIFLPMVQGRILADNRLEQKSISERVDFIADSGSIIRDNLILGTGIGNYTFELIKSNPNQSAWNYQPVHNIYLLILSEVGILGFAVFVLLTIFTFIVGLKNKNYIFVGLMAGFIIIGIFEHTFWTSWQGLALWWLGMELMVIKN